MTGVRVCDALERREIDVRAREVVNATGVWTDDVQDLRRRARQVQGPRLEGRPPRRPARPAAARHRADPAHRDERAVRDPVGPALDRRHHRHRLGARQGAPGGVVDATSTTCSSGSTPCSPQPLTREDVEGVYAGLRPLLTGESESTRGSRASTPSPCPCPGLVAVAGGKYTTYRIMAPRRDRRRRPRARPARCRPRPPTSRRWRARPASRRCGTGASGSPRRPGCTSRASSTCCAATGRSPRSCWRWSRDDPSLGEPLQGADDYLAVEIRYAAAHEGALHLDDVLTRRTRISIETWDRGARGRRAGRAADGRAAGLGRGDDRARDRALPRARRAPSAARRSSPTTRGRPRAHQRARRVPA